MIVGIDLAAKPKNPTGICVFYDTKNYEIFCVHDDEEIVNVAKNAEIIAIDAPLMEEIRIRKADMELKKYGAMPPTMKSMRMLTHRAIKIAKKLKGKIMEVFPTASAKILGIYDKDYKKMADQLGITAKNKHEVDAYLAAYTAYLYSIGKGIAVGDKEKIIIPKMD